MSKLALAATAWYAVAALASSLWSVYASATLWRSVVYLGLAVLALVIAGLPDDELSQTLMMVSSIAVASSLAVIAVWPDAGLDRDDNWIGIYTNRNSLAPLAALGVISGLRWMLPTSAHCSRPAPHHSEAGSTTRLEAERVGHSSRGSRRALSEAVARAARERSEQEREARCCTASRFTYPRLFLADLVRASRRRAFGAALAAASVTTLIRAGSRTGLLALSAALAGATVLGAAAQLRRRRGRAQARAAACAGILASAAGCAAAALALWDIPTFEQRRTIWSLAWDRFLERPWGGHGFFAFWGVPELVSQHELLQRGSAHNSLVETALGLGVLGTVPFVMLVGLAAFNAGRGLWLRPAADTWMWAAVTALVLVENATESLVLWFSYIWVLLLAAALRTGCSVPAASPGAVARTSRR